MFYQVNILHLFNVSDITNPIFTMAGEPELTGLAKTFNSVTFTGRANVAKVK